MCVLSAARSDERVASPERQLRRLTRVVTSPSSCDVDGAPRLGSSPVRADDGRIAPARGARTPGSAPGSAYGSSTAVGHFPVGGAELAGAARLSIPPVRLLRQATHIVYVRCVPFRNVCSVVKESTMREGCGSGKAAARTSLTGRSCLIHEHRTRRGV